jgi:predicted PurR-regulated permease PerM
MTVERALMALLLGGIAVGCTLVLYPFLSAILWAAILTFTTWPVFMVVRQRVGRVLAAGAMVAVTAVVVVVPLALAVPSRTGDVAQIERVVQSWVDSGLPGAPSWLGSVPGVGAWAVAFWDQWAADLSGLVDVFRPYFGMAAQLGLRVLLGLANGVLEFALALVVAFFLFASGDELADKVVALMRRIAGPQADRLIAVTGATVRGVVYGILGTAVVQGILSTFGFWLSGVPRPALLGVIAGGLSVLPIGAPAVWIPAGLWLLSSGKTVWGIFLLLWGGVVISGADTLIRPYFIARGAKLPFLLTMLGVLGGALGFGLLGVFMGPVLLGVGFTLVVEWAGTETRAAGLHRMKPP